MSHEAEQSHQMPEEPLPDDELPDIEPGAKRLSFIDRLSRKQRVGLAVGVLAGVIAIGLGGAKAIEAANSTNGTSPGIPTAGASVVPGSTEQPSASSSERTVESPNDPIGSRNDMTVFESSEVSDMYRSVPTNSIFNALKDCSQAEIDTIRQVLKGYEDPATMTHILNQHGVRTDAWLPDSATPAKS